MQRGVGNVNPMKMARCIKELERIYGVRDGSAGLCDRNNFYGKNQSSLADEMGITQRQLTNYKQLLKLIPELQELVEKDKIKPTVAHKILAKLPEKIIKKFLQT